MQIEGVEFREALEMLAARRPDLLILDIIMPGMDGYEVCHRLKADDRTRDIPIIFISALEHALNKVTAFSAGAVDYLTKPFEIIEIPYILYCNIISILFE
mgnify:CR=1 FL=1